MNDSYVATRNGKVSALVGPDAVNLFRAIQLKGAIKLYRQTGMIPTRGVTITKMLEIATKDYTHKAYKGKNKCEAAEADLQEWVEAMKAAMPVVEGG